LWVLAKQGKYDEVKEAIFSAFENVSDAQRNPWLLNSLGVAELNLGEYKKAEASFLKAKEYAKALTPEEWSRSYPGNNPQGASAGLKQFLDAIEGNLLRTQ